MKQGTQEWLDARRGRVTASMVGAILGFAPYMTRKDAMRRMVRDYHGVEPEFTGNIATTWGSANEEGAKFDFTLETGLEVAQCGFFEYEDWAGASPDGLTGKDALIEIKCPFSLRNELKPRFKSINEQPHYYAQVQFQLLCTGLGACYFYQWAPNGNYVEVVERNEKWIAEYLPKIREFYQEFKKEITNPDHLEPKRKEVETLSARSLLAEYDELSLEIELAQSRLKDIIIELEAQAGGRDAMICGRKFTKVKRAGSVSYAKVVKDHLPDIDLEPYRGKPSEYWKLS